MTREFSASLKGKDSKHQPCDADQDLKAAIITIS